MTYQLTSGDTILRLSDNAYIPQAPGNRDYREYQAWLSEGNTPLPAPVEAPPAEPTLPEKLTRIGLTPADLVAVLESEADIRVADLKRAIQAVGPA